MPQTIDVRVVRRYQAAQDIVCLELTPTASPMLPMFEPGAHIDLHLPSGAVRQYSLCGDPKITHRYRLGILKDAAGRGGSMEVHESLLEGSALKIGMPRNAFPLVKDAAHSVLIAGGIGVTPLLAMAISLRDAGRSFEFHYLTRSSRRAAFADELVDCCGLARFRLYSGEAKAGIGFNASLSPRWVRKSGSSNRVSGREEAKAKLITAGRILDAAGQGDLTRGHVSVRVPGEPDYFFMKPHSHGLDEITSENIVLCNREGEKVGGGGRRHSEVFIHSEIFKARPDVMSVIHSHPTHAVAFSATGRALLPISQPAAAFADGVPYFTDTIDLIRSQDFGAGVARALGRCKAVLLRNHGAGIVGASLEEPWCWR